MYAMLTGTLPFTVEPFSLRALYQKMVDKEMNPLPTQLSTGEAPVPIEASRAGAGSDLRGVRAAVARGLPPELGLVASAGVSRLRTATRSPPPLSPPIRIPTNPFLPLHAREGLLEAPLREELRA